MDGTSLELPLFIVATFAGALVAGMSGFAFGLIAASINLALHPCSPADRQLDDRGFKLFGHIGEGVFRKIVLVLLLASARS